MNIKKALLLGIIPTSFIGSAFFTNIKADEQTVSSSDYTVTIPSETTISRTENTGTLNFNGTLNPYKKLDVAITSKNDYKLVNGSDSFSYTLDKDSFSYSTVLDSTSFNETLNLEADSNTEKKFSGKYTDQLTFTFTDTTRNFLDINGWLDGAEFDDEDMSEIASCDIYINGVQVADDVSDWWKEYDAGTTYEIKDIKVKSDEYAYTGLQSGTLSGIVSGRTNVNLNFVTTKVITLDANGGQFSDGTSTQTVRVAPNSEYGTLPEPTQDGYSFNGWYIKGTETLITSSSVLGTENVTLEAKWSAKYVFLQTGKEFNANIPSTATSVVFTDEIAPSTASITDVSANSDSSVVAWLGIGEDDTTTWYVSSQTDGQVIKFNENCFNMFFNKTNLTSISFGNYIDTSNVTNMGGMFDNCYGMETLDLSSFDTSNVTYMGYMFNYCSRLTSLNVSNFDTSKVTSMIMMFNGCSRLTSLDLSSFDTTNVKTIDGILELCKNLTTVFVRSEADKTRLSNLNGTPSTITFVVKSSDESSDDENVAIASLNTDTENEVNDVSNTKEVSTCDSDTKTTESEEQTDEETVNTEDSLESETLSQSNLGN